MDLTKTKIKKFRSVPAAPARPRRGIREDAREVDEVDGERRVRIAALRAVMAASEVAIALLRRRIWEIGG